MRSIRIIIIALFAFASTHAFAQTASPDAQIESVKIQASGLTCSMCSRAIYKSLLKVPSVAKVEEDIQHSTYTIQFKDHAKIVLDDLRKAVKDAGFSVAKLEVRTKQNG
jgi:copper chaperone CopZ